MIYKFQPDTEQEYDESPWWGVCFADPEKKIVHLEAYDGSFSKNNSYYVKTRSDSYKIFEIPFDHIKALSFTAKMMEYTTENSEGDDVVNHYKIYFLYAKGNDGKLLPCSLAEGSELLEIRDISEGLAKTLKVDIEDCTGENVEIRKHTELDLPWYEKLKTFGDRNFTCSDNSEGLTFRKESDRWTLNGIAGCSTAKNAFFGGGGCGFFILLTIISPFLIWYFAPGASGFWTFLYALFFIIIYFSMRVRVQYIITPEKFIYIENLWGYKYKDEMDLEDLEEIQVAKIEHDGYPTLQLISDDKLLQYQLSDVFQIKMLYAFLNNAIAYYKIDSFDAPFLKSNPPVQDGLKSKILNLFDFLPGVIFVISILFFILSVFSSWDPSKVIILSKQPAKAVKNVKKTNTGYKRRYYRKSYNTSAQVYSTKVEKLKFAKKTYLAKVDFKINYSWGAEGGYVLNAKFVNNSTNEPDYVLSDEFYAAKWNDESMTSSISGTLPNFEPSSAGEYNFDVTMDFGKAKEKYDLHLKVQAVTLTFYDYCKNHRFALYFFYLALFSILLVFTDQATTFSIVIRCITFFVFLYFLNMSLLEAGPTVKKTRGPRGRVHYVMVHRYRFGRVFRGGGPRGGGK